MSDEVPEVEPIKVRIVKEPDAPEIIEDLDYENFEMSDDDIEELEKVG